MNNNKNIARIILWTIGIISCIALFIYCRKQFTFGFLPLFIALIILMSLPLLIKEKSVIVRKNSHTATATYEFAKRPRSSKDLDRKGIIGLVCFLGIIVFGSLALYSLGNYFNPRTEVYSNYQHHALKVEGIKISGNDFLLAENSEKAFLDSPEYRGSVKVIGHDADSVTLSLKGLANPFYRKITSKKHVNLNHSIITFNEGDKVELVSEELNQSGDNRKVSFRIETSSKKHFLGLKRADNRSKFIFTEDGITDTSSFDRFLVSGYSLEGITADVPLIMDIRGINIVRDRIDLDAKRNEIYSLYKERQYCLEIEPSANIKSVRINDREFPQNAYSENEVIVNVPYDEALYIGLGNNTRNAFKFCKGDGEDLHLCYEMPEYQMLTAVENSRTVNLMVTSSIIDNDNPEDGESGLLDNLTDNVIQFELFHNSLNRFNLQPFFVSYLIGPTSEIMEFSLLNPSSPEAGQRNIEAGEYFPDVKSMNGTQWLVQVENFRDTTPFNNTTLSWMLLAIILLFALSIVFSLIFEINSAYEYAAYLIVIGFLTIRFFLLWRVTVFPPISSVSLFEFNHLRNPKWLVWSMIGLGVFVILINGAKVFVVRQMKRPKTRSIRSTKNPLLNLWYSVTRPGFFCFLLFLVYVIGFFVCKAFGSPVFAVFLPTLAYIVLDSIIYSTYGKDYQNDFSPEDEGFDRYGVFVISVLNMVLACGVTLLLDGGFGIMFSMFALFALWFKVMDIFQYTKRYENYRKVDVKIAQVVLFIMLAAIIIEYKHIFLEAVKRLFQSEGILSSLPFIACAAAAVLIVVMCVLVLFDFPFKKTAIWSGILAGVCFFGLWAGSLLFAGDFSGSHMEYRAKVNIKNAGEIMAEIETQSQQDKFLQASLNDWILYEYDDIGKGIKTFGENGIGYFKIQPQSKLGAMWFAQTTDICLSRFIIAEHGKPLAWGLVLAFLALLYIAIKTPSGLRWTKIVAVQVALILAVQSLMILLANTRAFLFFGQDFPLISLTSKVSSVYFFVLTGIAVACSILGKHHYDIIVNSSSIDKCKVYLKLRAKDKSLGRNILVLFIVSAVSLAAGVSVLNLGDQDRKGDKTRQSADNALDDLSERAYYLGRTYDVDVLLAQMNKDFEDYLNPAFTEYQRIYGVPELKKNMSIYVAKALSDTIWCADSSLCSNFTLRMLDQYKAVGSKNNSRNSLVYLQYRRVYDDNFRKYDTLEFKVRNEFYKYELPGNAKIQWKGSLIESNADVLSSEARSYDKGKYSYAYVPGKYTADGNPIQLLRIKDGSKLSIVGSNAMMTADSTVGCLKIEPEDYVMQGSKTLNDLPLKKCDYIARRLLLNGKWTFIYPHGHQMLWARNETAKYQKKLSADDGDVYMSVSPDLVADIYNVYRKGAEKSADDKTVIVADGDGFIRAMVDYRSDSKYRVNPNDEKKIAEITDSLYMYGERGRSSEIRYFGNFARDFLRRGPGSSQKPILWTAVTSMYNTGWWDDLEFAGVPENVQQGKIHPSSKDGSYDRERYAFNRYAGEGIEKKGGFVSPVVDEGNGGPVNLQSYMYKSSNYYNSIIAYIGAFDKQTMQKDGFLDVTDSDRKDESTLFRKAPRIRLPQKMSDPAAQQQEYARYNNDYANQFPWINIGSQAGRRNLVFNKFITYDLAMDTTALAPKGLSENFGLRTVRSKNPVNDPSRYNIKVREHREAERQLNEYVVRSVAVGSNTIWQVSPLKMAEMYGRIASMNKAYTLTLEEPINHLSRDYEMFNLDESYDAQNSDVKYSNYLKSRKDLVIGMSKVYSSGTAKSLGLTSVELAPGRKMSIDLGDGDYQDFYVYGKTGTINGKWGEPTDREDHLLATIITDTRLSTATPEELSKMKFYVIYQVDYVHKASWKSIDKSVIEAVIRSDVFQTYMGLKQ